MGYVVVAEVISIYSIGEKKLARSEERSCAHFWILRAP